MAVYDFRPGPPLAAVITTALRERTQAGVTIRIAYDADKPETPRLDAGMDSVPSGTGAFVQALGYPWRRIAGLFMHNKVLVVDHTLITGSHNFSRSAELNAENLLIIENAALADAYSAYIDHLMTKYQHHSVGDIGV